MFRGLVKSLWLFDSYRLMIMLLSPAAPKAPPYALVLESGV